MSNIPKDNLTRGRESGTPNHRFGGINKWLTEFKRRVVFVRRNSLQPTDNQLGIEAVSPPAPPREGIASGKIAVDELPKIKRPTISALPSGPLGYIESANPNGQKLPDEIFLEHLRNQSIARQKAESERRPIGTKLKPMRDLVEKGFNSEGTKLKVASSLGDLAPGLKQAIDTNSIGVANKAYYSRGAPEYLASIRQEVINRETGEKVETDGYNQMVNLYKQMPGGEVRLVQYGNEIVTVVSYDASENLQVIQVLEPGFPPTQKYLKYLNQIVISNSFPRQLDSSDIKERYVRARNLILVDKQHGTMIDFKQLIPPDWTLRHIPSTDVRVCMESTPQKFIQYPEIVKPSFLIGVLHEWGHGVNNLADPQVFAETQELWKRANDPFEGVKNMSVAEIDRFRVLQSMAERGATAIATQLLRSLQEQGFNPGFSMKEFRDQAQEALASYDRRYSVGQERVFSKKKEIL